MTQVETFAMRKVITVEAPQQRAFEVFTTGMSSWWPMDSHHIAEADAVEVVVEPRAGGRWFERSADGAECDWGKVLEWDPYDRIVFGWQLTAEFAYDASFSTDVEVRFIAESPTRTRVELEHRNLDRYGEAAEQMREALGSDGGWNGLLQLFQEKVESAS
jgi:uncharacterized protein YndB with AHSA1/START domain